MKKARERMILRFATLSDRAELTAAERSEMDMIEDQLHLSREEILIEAGKTMLSRHPSREPTREERERYQKGGTAFREGMEELKRSRKLC